MIFDKIISSGRITICKVVLLLTVLRIFSVTFGCAAVYQDSSFRKFHLDEITLIRQPGLLNCPTNDNLHPDFKIGTIVNKPVWFIAFVSPDKLVIDLNVYASKFSPAYNILYLLTNPAAGTESIGLPADALAVKFFAAQLIMFTLTRNISVVYRDLQKTRQP